MWSTLSFFTYSNESTRVFWSKSAFLNEKNTQIIFSNFKIYFFENKSEIKVSFLLQSSSLSICNLYLSKLPALLCKIVRISWKWLSFYNVKLLTTSLIPCYVPHIFLVPLSYNWKIFSLFFFFKGRGFSWAHQKVKQHPCGECPFRVLWELYTWFLNIYLSFDALLQKFSPCRMPDVDFCRLKINKVDAIRTSDLVFDIWFDISYG